MLVRVSSPGRVAWAILLFGLACSPGDEPYEGAPLVGTWREETQIACGTGAEVPVPANSRINELVLRADGTFSVTWMPFESYKDYWGRFQADIPEGRLSLFVDYGNHVPPNLDLEGSHEVAPGGHLVLRDLWLGASLRSAGAASACGHAFSRRS